VGYLRARVAQRGLRTSKGQGSGRAHTRQCCR
jgi:hypothetical protein